MSFLDLDHLFNKTDLLVATTGQVESAYLPLEEYGALIVTKKSTGGTYAFEIDWSTDGGTTADFTQVVVLTDNVPLKLEVAAKHARFRVKNTGGAAFTVHRTLVAGRSAG